MIYNDSLLHCTQSESVHKLYILLLMRNGRFEKVLEPYKQEYDMLQGQSFTVESQH